MRRLILALVLILASTPVMVNASVKTLSSAQETYMYGDTIRITANVTNAGDTPIRVYIEHTLRDLGGRVATGYLLRVVDLGPHEAKVVELYDVKIDEGFYSGQYTVWASLIINKIRIAEEELSFTVEGAPEDMEARLLISSDPDYARVSRVFIMGEKAYMGLSGAPQGVAVSVMLKLPDNSTEQISMPAALTVKKAGRYTVYLNASVQGYRDMRIRDSFSVLDASPKSLSDRKEESMVSLHLEKTSYTVGDEVVATGEVSPSHASASVTLTFVRGGASEASVTATTDDDGRYRITYEVDSDGQWTVKAMWGGDSNHEASESQRLDFTVEAPPASNWLPLALASIAIMIVALFLVLRRKG